MKKHETNRQYSSDLPNLYDIFLCEVANIQQYGIFVKIPGYKKNGLVHKSQMSKTKIDDPSDMVEPHDRVYCKVISIDQDGEKIGMSMKVVNQTTGQDLDPGHVQTALDEQRRKTGHVKEIPRIELGAVLDTTCKKCGGQGHLAQDCFHVSGGKSYSLLPDLEYLAKQERESKHKQKKKKEKLSKKEKKAKKKAKKQKKAQSREENNIKRHKKSHKRKLSETIDSGSDTSEDDLWVKKSRQEQDVETTSTREERANRTPNKEQHTTKHSTDRCVDIRNDKRISGRSGTERDRKYSDRTGAKDEGRRHSHHRSKAKNRHGDSD